MFLKNKLAPEVNPGPPGCNPPREEDRMPLMRVVSGDTWVVSAALVAADGGPASVNNSYVEFVLAENQFSPPLWTGEWFNGINMDRFRPGLVHVNIPRELTKTLRRGSYMFSMRVADKTRFSFNTQLVGYFLVEYMPTSDQHSIPYRDGTSEIFGGTYSCDDFASVRDGVIRIIDESTGLYYKVSAYKTEDGEVCLGIYQEGETEQQVAMLGVGRTLYVKDAKTGLYHRLVAYKSEEGEICLGIYQVGVKKEDAPGATEPVRIRNDENGVFHKIEAVKSEDGEVNVATHQSGTMV